MTHPPIIPIDTPAPPAPVPKETTPTVRSFFTSDLHYGHENIIRFCKRPFSNVDEMDNALIENHNKVVGKTDIIYILGDVSYRTPVETVNIFRRLNGVKVIVKGNHDKPETMQALRESGLVHRIHDYYELVDKPTKAKFVLMHYPLLTWRADRHGTIHLHGHCHGEIDRSHNTDVLRMDVGVDSHNYTPISMEYVISVMEKRRIQIEKSGKKLGEVRGR